MSDEDVIDRANRGTKEWLERADQCITAGKPADAKKMVTNAQKEIRAIKAEVVAEEKEVRAKFADDHMKASQSGQTLALFMNSKNRSRIARTRAIGKRSIAQQKKDALDEYRVTKAALDQAILQLDRVKLDIDLGKFDSVEAEAEIEVGEQAAETLESPAQPAAWLADPTGRHQHRYWDGTQWTEHVADAGNQSTDPMR